MKFKKGRTGVLIKKDRMSNLAKKGRMTIHEKKLDKLIKKAGPNRVQTIFFILATPLKVKW